MKEPNGYAYVLRADGWMRTDSYTGRVDRALDDKDESKHCFGASMKIKCKLCTHRLEHTMAMHAQALKEDGTVK